MQLSCVVTMQKYNSASNSHHQFWVLTNFRNDVTVKMSYKQ